MKLKKTCIVLMVSMFIASCSTQGNSKLITVSGVVEDQISKERLPNIAVELLVLDRGNLFRMGSFKLEAQSETDISGKFEFTVEEGDTINIWTLSVDNPRKEMGALYAIRRISEDHLDIVIQHSQTGPTFINDGP